MSDDHYMFHLIVNLYLNCHAFKILPQNAASFPDIYSHESKWRDVVLCIKEACQGRQSLDESDDSEGGRPAGWAARLRPLPVIWCQSLPGCWMTGWSLCRQSEARRPAPRSPAWRSWQCICSVGRSGDERRGDERRREERRAEERRGEERRGEKGGSSPRQWCRFHCLEQLLGFSQTQPVHCPTVYCNSL